MKLNAFQGKLLENCVDLSFPKKLNYLRKNILTSEITQEKQPKYNFFSSKNNKRSRDKVNLKQFVEQ